MVVFVEDIFVENFVIFFMQNFLVQKSIAQKVSLGRVIYSSIISAIIVVVGGYCGLGSFGQIMLLGLNIILSVLLSQKGTKKIFVSIILSVTYLLVIDGTKSFFIKKLSLSRPFVIFILLAYFILLLALIRHFYIIKRHKKFEYKITFYNGSNVFSTVGYLDSGNFLEDDLTGKGIVVIDYNTFLHITGYSIENLLNNSWLLKNSHYIDYSTINGGQKMLVFDVDCVEIDGNKKECMLGLNLRGFENGYSALLGVKILEEGL